MTRPRAPLCAVRIGVHPARRIDRNYRHAFGTWSLCGDDDSDRVELVAVSERDIVKPPTRAPKLIEG